MTVYGVLGEIAGEDKKPDVAIQWLTRDLNTARKRYALATTVPNLSYLRSVSGALYDELVNAHRQSEGAAVWKGLADSAETLLAQLRSDDTLRECVLTYTGLAETATDEKDAAQAQHYLARAEALAQSLSQDTPDGNYARYLSFDKLGELLGKNGTPAAARASYVLAGQAVERYLKFAAASVPKFAAADNLHSLVELYGGLSWTEDLAGEFTKALDAARHGLELEPNAAWIEANLAHALLLTGKKQEAIEHYRDVRSKPSIDDRPMVDVIEEDFQTLRSLGLGDPAMEEILKLLRAK
jgi:tetratricopeptide (TPR) repeat protein